MMIRANCLIAISMMWSGEICAEGPITAEEFLLRGDERVKKADFEGALRDYSEAIRLDPNDARLYVVRGAVWGRKGDLDKSLADLTTAIRLDQASPSAYFNRGFTWE